MLIAYDKDGKKLAEGENEVILSGLTPATKYEKGYFKISRKEGEFESNKVDIPTFETLPIEVTGITLDKTTLAQFAGDEYKLNATVLPDDATDKTVTWTTGNSTIAKVNTDGIVSAIAAGKVRITAKAGDKTIFCEVTVKEPTE